MEIASLDQIINKLVILMYHLQFLLIQSTNNESKFYFKTAQTFGLVSESPHLFASLPV